MQLSKIFGFGSWKKPRFRFRFFRNSLKLWVIEKASFISADFTVVDQRGWLHSTQHCTILEDEGAALDNLFILSTLSTQFFCQTQEGKWEGACMVFLPLSLIHRVQNFRWNLIEKLFYTNAHLKHHIELYHEKIEGKYKCSFCSFKTYAKNNLFAHIGRCPYKSTSK